MAYNIKTIKEEFKAKGIFYTPPELAIKLKEYLDFEPFEVYDPTCGAGSLLSVFSDNCKKYGQELNSGQLEEAKKELVNFEGVCGDTLVNPAFMDKKFQCIIANPPFSIHWDPKVDERFEDCIALPPKSKADYAFLLHIIYLLSNTGTAIVLNFPGILYRSNSEGKIRKWIIEQNLIEKVIMIKGDTFVDTKINTVILVIKKNKTTTDILFVNENGEERIVPLTEIVANDYNLSCSQYIQNKTEKIKVDPYILEEKSQNVLLKKLRAELSFTQMVSQIEGWDNLTERFVKKIELVIKEFKPKPIIKQPNQEFII